MDFFVRNLNTLSFHLLISHVRFHHVPFDTVFVRTEKDVPRYVCVIYCRSKANNSNLYYLKSKQLLLFVFIL